MNDDIDHIMTVMEHAFDPGFGEAWNRLQVENAILVPSTHYGLADIDGNPLSAGAQPGGFYLSRSSDQEEELLLIAVLPQYRKRGIASRLLEQLIKEAQLRGVSSLFLQMRDGNPAESLYKKYGFSPIGRRKNYYKTINYNRVDAITFSCKINHQLV